MPFKLDENQTRAVFFSKKKMCMSHGILESRAMRRVRQACEGGMCCDDDSPSPIAEPPHAGNTPSFSFRVYCTGFLAIAMMDVACKLNFEFLPKMPER